jgi:hypothetical protein
MKKKFTLILFCLTPLIFSACGTYMPMPAPGGGKRFAYEQALIAATLRKSVDKIPFKDIAGKKIILNIQVIADEGGGALSQGRPYLSAPVNVQHQSQNAMTGSTNVLNYGLSSSKNDVNYTKDMTYMSSDARYVNAITTAAAQRYNIMINPNKDEGTADFTVDILVDVLGTVRKRTDWLLINNESLAAHVSMSFIIKPLKNIGVPVKQGRVGFEGEYKEIYALWMGPVEAGFDIKEAKEINGLMLDNNETADSFENLVRKPSDSNFQTFTPMNDPMHLTPNPDFSGGMMPNPAAK